MHNYEPLRTQLRKSSHTPRQHPVSVPCTSRSNGLAQVGQTPRVLRSFPPCQRRRSVTRFPFLRPARPEVFRNLAADEIVVTSIEFCRDCALALFQLSQGARPQQLSAFFLRTDRGRNVGGDPLGNLNRRDGPPELARYLLADVRVPARAAESRASAGSNPYRAALVLTMQLSAPRQPGCRISSLS